MSKYLEFVKVESATKTQKFDVDNKSGDNLGRISFYPQWRKYVFQPSNGGIIFDADCLNDITSYLTKLNLERKVEFQNKKLQ